MWELRRSDVIDPDDNHEFLVWGDGCATHLRTVAGSMSPVMAIGADARRK